MSEAATGIKMIKEELDKAAVRSRLLFRAILIRNFGRTREMEVNAIFPIMTYPDSNNETITRRLLSRPKLFEKDDNFPKGVIINESFVCQHSQRTGKRRI